MEWVVKLEAKSGRGEVETIEVGGVKRRVVGLTAEEVGLTLAEGKYLLGELGRLVLQTQMEAGSPYFLMQLGEVTPGGVGSGFYTIIVFALLSVFVAGLMVG
jgi:hypothetical protein